MSPASACRTVAPPVREGLTANGLLLLAIVAGAAGMWGVYLDTAWHRTVGRDSFFILPHLFIYGGGLGVWAAGLGGITLATLGVGEVGGPQGRVGPLRLPFGFTLAAFGIVVTMAAAPFDAWWHNTFGKDVLIWSPPHLQLHLGAGIAAVGLLFAVAGQRGRGALASHRLWRTAMVAVLVDLVHRTHFVLAHYTMLPATRTEDLYPFIVALMAPGILVAAARVLGFVAPVEATVAFVGVAALVDAGLLALGYDRYTLTPILAVPAMAISGVALWPRGIHRASAGAMAGVLFALVFVATETLAMARIVGHPWRPEAVVAALPATLLAAALSGWVGWAVGGFLRITAGLTGVRDEFATPARARAAALVAVALVAIGLAATYRPQQFGPPMKPAELSLAPTGDLRAQEAVFWEALLDDDWGVGRRLEARSEGVIDRAPLPIGPAWCADTPEALERQMPALAFRLEVNGVPVDLGAYPLLRRPVPDGRHCAWVGVVSLTQRASVNRFVYTIDPGPAVAPPTVVETTVVFKDP
jgi:hypothetical protein